MNSIDHKELISLIGQFASEEGTNPTPIPGVYLFKASGTDAPVPTVYSPCLCIIAQGHKDVFLDKEKYKYGPLQYLAVSVNLPLMNKITKASKDKPYLLIKIDMDVKQIADLLVNAGISTNIPNKASRGIFVGNLDDNMGDAILRLCRLLKAPSEIPVLATQFLREIYYRVLLSKNGALFSQVALKGSPLQSIGKVILHIKENFYKPVSVNDLAIIANMSISALHAQFKSVTAMTPLQFQKNLRLIEARSLILNTDIDVASAAYQVGYQSASQFSREYSRMFMTTPKQDMASTKGKGNG